MPINPVSGDITSQELNDNFSYLDSSINEKTATTSLNIKGVNALGSIANNVQEPTLTIIDDDTRNELYDLLFPSIQTKNIPITAALISGRIGVSQNTITYDQFKEMKDSGLVEYVNHTRDHERLADLTTEEDIDYQIRKCEEWLRKEGIFTSHLVYPFGSFNDTVRKVATKYVNSGSKVDGSVINDPQNNVLDSYLVDRVSFELTQSEIESKIDETFNNNGWIILAVHSHYTDFSITKFEDIIDYAQTKGVAIKTYGEAYRQFSNVLELRENGNLKLGVSASGYQSGVKDYVKNPTEKKYASDVPGDFPSDTTSVYIYNGPEATEYGFPSAGTLINHNIGTTDYSFQEFHPVGSNSIQKRYWDKNLATPDWSAWAEVGSP